MLKAWTEIRRIAIQEGLYHQGVPATTVIHDGVGPKRLISMLKILRYLWGKNKLLYTGVRHRYFRVCQRA